MNWPVRHPRPLNPAQRAFCWLVLQLDRIPRYGRYYRLDTKTGTVGPALWRFQRHGRWGMYILLDMNLFFRYIDEDMKEIDT